jgi:hypothetical protein
MIPDYVSGSDIAEKTGWNEDTMLQLFSEFLAANNLEDKWLDFLNDRADEELSYSDEEG